LIILVRGGIHGHAAGGHSHAIPQLPADYQEGTKKTQKETEMAQITESDLVSNISINDKVSKTDFETQQTDIPVPTLTAGNKIVRGTEEQVAQAYIFFVALSIHSVFDGLSIGSATTMDGFYALLGAVVGHKALDGFALGVPVFFADLPLFHMWFALIFTALMTPMGTIIGIAATSGVAGIHGQLSKAIILSISAGSFYFISLVELLPAGLQDGKHLKFKFLVTSVGFGMMALVAIWV